MPLLSPRQHARLKLLRDWSRLLDSAFEVPGIHVRFGLDPIVGLVPWLGDLVSPAFSVAVLVTAVQLGVPRTIQARMVLNVVIDGLLGVVPVVGDLFDFAWKANDRNMALLEHHAGGERAVTTADKVFVGAAVGVVLLCALVPAALLVWILSAARG